MKKEERYTCLGRLNNAHTPHWVWAYVFGGEVPEGMKIEQMGGRQAGRLWRTWVMRPKKDQQ